MILLHPKTHDTLDTIILMPSLIEGFLADMREQGFLISPIQVSWRHNHAGFNGKNALFSIDPEKLAELRLATDRWMESLISPYMRIYMERKGQDVSKMSPPNPRYYENGEKRRPLKQGRSW